MKRSQIDPYVTFLLDEWKIVGNLRRVVAAALGEFSAETHLILRREPRLQVEVLGMAPETWAYFPIRQGQIGDEHLNVQLGLLVDGGRLKLRPGAEVLLLLKGRRKHGQTEQGQIGEIVHHFGHTLLYLRNPKAKNDCADANRERNRHTHGKD